LSPDGNVQDVAVPVDGPPHVLQPAADLDATRPADVPAPIDE
jgi:hypothetical protein